MSKVLAAELSKQDADDGDLHDSVAEDEVAKPITEAQQRELRRRLAEYRADAGEPMMTLADIRRELDLPRT